MLLEDNTPTDITSFYNNTLQLKGIKGEYIYEKVTQTGTFYEIEMLKYIQSLQLTNTVLDIGANIGNHTLFFASQCNFSNVIAVEPYMPIYNILEENIRLNKIVEKVELHFNAIDNIDGREVCIEPATTENLGKTKVKEGRGIPTVTIDKIAERRKVDLIKIDVEGYELKALEGAVHTLTNQKPVLFVEAYSSKEKDPIDAFLKPFGYSSKKVFGITSTYEYRYTT